MKSYVVIGLGRFGMDLAASLYERGEEVLAIDNDESLVDKMADRVTRAVAADARDRDVLERLGVESFDRAIVAVGTDLASSALITMNLKALKIPYILCKAGDDTHREILERLGADRVIIPEREMAEKLAISMTSTGILDFIELSDEYGIVEMTVPARWRGKTVQDLNLRSRFGINVIAIREGEKIGIPPDVNLPLQENMILVMLGRYDQINRLKN